MRINCYAVGKIKEPYLKEGIAEFTKRLGAYTQLNIEEISDEAAPESLSALEAVRIKDCEGERILKKIGEDDYVIALDLRGKELTSESFAKKISALQLEGHSTIDFVIGSSLGLSSRVLARANMQLSFGKMTYPHMLMRLILLEQIYRAFRIINNHPYHK